MVAGSKFRIARGKRSIDPVGLGAVIRLIGRSWISPPAGNQAVRNPQRERNARPILLSRVSDGTPRDHSFAQDCRALFEGFEEGVVFAPHVKARTNWLDATGDSQSPIPAAPGLG